MAKPVFLGELLLHWCKSCNLPLLDNKCGCGASAKKVTITPPGDIRPAFQYDLDLVNSIAMEQFNAPLIPDERVVILNKAPYDDRMDEIIVDGEVMATIRFEVDKLQWALLPRLNGARRIFQDRDRKELTNWIVVDKGAIKFILEGANLMAPGVMDADPNIGDREEVVILTPEGEVLGAGRSRMTGSKMLERGKGMAVKLRWKEEPKRIEIPEGGQTWDDAIEANKEILDQFEEKAHTFIRNVSSSANRPTSVSYSGGKDSLAVLQLVDDCLDEYDILFADTGLEFPETVKNVEDAAERYGHPLKMIGVGEAFWESIEDFGPPSVEARWCCKVCKLGPITQLIEDNFDNGCLTYIGQRKYESDARAKSERVWKNPWVANQIGAAPIQDWTALHVWLYIFRNKAPYNPLYEKGFDRMGCWLCPSSSLADLVRLKETHPEMEQKLNDHLVRYAESMGLSKDWVEHGFWRWKKLPQILREIAKSKGIEVIPKGTSQAALKFTMTSGYRPCKAGGMSAEGSFARAIDLSRLEDMGMLLPVGQVSYMEGIASVLQGEDRAQIFASGNVTARSDTEDKAKKLMRGVELSIRRAIKCMGCGVCVGRCSRNVIKVKKKQKMAIVGEGCNHCGACIEVCPVVKFADQE